MQNKKIKMTVLYPKFWPLFGGWAIHGYNLFKELAAKDYSLKLMINENLPFGKSVPTGIKSLVLSAITSDVIYYRPNPKERIWLVIALLRKLFNKKVVVELNAPADEYSRSDKVLTQKEKRLKIICKNSDAVITISKELAEYVKTTLGISHVQAVSNGGEVFSVSKSTSGEQTEIDVLKNKFKKLIVWTGTGMTVPHEDIITKLVEVNTDCAFVFISHDEAVKRVFPKKENCRYFIGCDRDNVKQIISACDIGLALYNEPDLKNIGYYYSPLKLYEYLANNLGVIASPLGEMNRLKSQNYIASHEVSEINKFIKHFSWKDEPARTWTTVAEETDDIIKKVLASKEIGGEG